MRTEPDRAKRTGQKDINELGTRVRTGAVMTIVGYFVLRFSGYPYILNVAAAVLSVLGIFELLRAVNQYSLPKMLILSFIAIVICVWGVPSYQIVLWIAWILAFAAFLIPMLQGGRLRFSNFMQILPCTLILPLFFRSFVELRQFRHGLYLVTLVILGCMVNDIGAYFVGKAMGKHKLAPAISPGKTIEGCLGGILISTALMLLFSGIYAHFMEETIRYGILIVYLILASCIGPFGDLAMSMIKRSVGIKDFGKILPGHGGILDRFDSMLFTAPFALLYCGMTGGFFR